MNKLAILSLIVLCVAGQSYDDFDLTYEDTWVYDNSSYNWDDFYYEYANETVEEVDDFITIEINKSMLQDFVADFVEFDMNAVEATTQSLESAKLEVASAVKNVYAKLLLDFGKTFAPYFKNLGEVFENFQAEGEYCDSECGISCFNPAYYGQETFGFDTECLALCGCSFKLLNMTAEDEAELMEDLVEAELYGKASGEWVLQEGSIVASRVGSALSEVAAVQQELNTELNELIQAKAVEIFGCDSDCVELCFDDSHVKHILQCIRGSCYCEQQMVSVDFGGYNYQSLMEYSDYNMQAWSFFKQYQHSI